MVSQRGRVRHVVLYSGGRTRRNAWLHESVLALALRDRRPGHRRVRMTYVPFTVEGALPFFRRFERRYRPFGGTHFACVPADLPELGRPGRARRRAAEQLCASDVVYLAGGNTFHFLHHLKRSGLLAVIRECAARGIVVAGMSAGAHLCTPDIRLAGYPPFDRDENEIRLPQRSLGALDLVDFEFFPHYRHSPRYRRALAAWSRRRQGRVYACRDGGGLVVDGDRIEAYGDVWLFEDGVERRIGS